MIIGWHSLKGCCVRFEALRNLRDFKKNVKINRKPARNVVERSPGGHKLKNV